MKAAEVEDSEVYHSFEGLYLLREECFIDKSDIRDKKEVIKTGGAMDGVRAL